MKIDLDRRVGKNFSFRELTHTNHRSFQAENWQHGWGLRATADAWARTIGDPIREHFGRPFITHSGFRCLRLNTAVKGSKTSQHMLFQGHDGHVDGVSLQDLFDYIRNSELPFGQVIMEGWVEGEPGWIHTSLGEPFRPIEKCRQAKTSFDGGITFHNV